MHACCCCSAWLPKQIQSSNFIFNWCRRQLLLNLSEGSHKAIFVSKSFSNFLCTKNKLFYAISSVWHFIASAPMAVVCKRHLAKGDQLQAKLKATALGACVEEYRFCGVASRVDEWIIVLAYHVISDQRANVFNFMLPAWVRALLSMANCVNGSSYQQIQETRASHVIVKKDYTWKSIW